MKALLFILIFVCAIPVAADTVVFTNVNVVPMDRERVLAKQTVVVKDGVIAEIGDAKKVKAPKNAVRVDGTGKYLIPGLVDMHTHLLSDSDEYPHSIGPHELRVMVANGVTTVRFMIGTPELLSLRNRSANGEIEAPSIFVASPHLTGREQGNNFVVNTPDEAREAVRKSKAAGYDFIKITTFIKSEVYEAAVDEAAKQNIRVVGHADSRFVGVERAWKAKQQIEHLDGYMELLLREDAPMKGSVSDLYIYNPDNWKSFDYIDESKIPEIARKTVASNPFVNPTHHFMKNSFGRLRTEDEIRKQPDFRFYPAKVQQQWLVTEDFFNVMGLGALHGRVPSREEFQPGRELVVVVSHGLWQRRFGGDPGVVGRRLTLDGKPFTVVGVMPPEFHLMDKRGMIAPYTLNESDARRRGANFLTVVGRLKPGVPLTQAQTDMRDVAGRLAQEYPQTNREMSATVVRISEQMLGGVRPALLVLLGAVALVLLIACANVASLMLARGSERGRELAIRAALGAGRFRVVRQLLTESLIIALLGGIFGVLLAWWGLDMILALSPGSLPRSEHVGISLPVLGFAIALSLMTAVGFGLVPSLHFSRSDLQDTLKEGGRTASAGVARHRLRRGLVVAEIALALVLLVGAGLLVRSFARLISVDPGFTPENALALQVHVYEQYPTPEQQSAFFEETLFRLAALPGVKAAGGTTAPPFEDGIEVDSDFAIHGQPPPAPGQEPTAQHTIVTSDFFRAIGVKLSRGRVFEKSDHANAPPVVIINETFARRYFPGEDPLGKQILVRRLTRPVVREIVGVVGDVRHTGLDSPTKPELFMHMLQVPFGSMTFVVRTDSDPVALLPAVKREVWSVNRNLPFYSVATMEQLVADTLKERRLSLALLGTFALLALAVAAVGLYGLISFSTSQRTHEIGVRMALGAQGRDIVKLILGEGLLLTLIGVALGAAGAFMLTSFMRGLLFGVSSSDPATYAAVAILLTAVALLACYLPARRATKVDPLIALRTE